MLSFRGMVIGFLLKCDGSMGRRKSNSRPVRGVFAAVIGF